MDFFGKKIAYFYSGQGNFIPLCMLLFFFNCRILANQLSAVFIASYCRYKYAEPKQMDFSGEKG